MRARVVSHYCAMHAHPTGSTAYLPALSQLSRRNRIGTFLYGRGNRSRIWWFQC